MEVVCSDFFESQGHEEGYDIKLDYMWVSPRPHSAPPLVLTMVSFLCALPPAFRSQWSSHLTNLSRPDSETTLITLMFPLGLPMDGHGPPHPLPEEGYHELLDARWQMVMSEEVPLEWRRRRGGKGEERLAVWRDGFEVSSASI